VQCKAYI